MTEERIRAIEEGKAFPYPVPVNEGTVMGLWDIGLVMLTQKFRLKDDELAAYKEGFGRYSYLERLDPIPLALWVFEFPEPLGKIDALFNARLARPEWLDSYLDTSAGGIMNALYMFLVEGKIYRAGKLLGLDPEAVEMFHATIAKQMAAEYTLETFKQAAAGLFRQSAPELFEEGRVFQFRED
ncbi:hypothetical protein [Desulfatiglans anilini]|uniref:hypothetical protein n=1 Tax=Desulfatiglans anilini TaxID=90728 RepID=UPI00040210D8|nr:hypothetical protein [Desulfatiglans anilini]